MIGRNEPIQRKAKFWQSYVRALKGKRLFLFGRTHDTEIGREPPIFGSNESYFWTISRRVHRDSVAVLGHSKILKFKASKVRLEYVQVEKIAKFVFLTTFLSFFFFLSYPKTLFSYYETYYFHLTSPISLKQF